MGNTNSERAGMGQGDKGHRRDSRVKEGDRPKILMDSPEDADIFHGEDIKAPSEKEEFLAWRQDLEADDKGPTLDRPMVFRWTGDGKEVFLSGSFNNWANKIPLIKSQNNFVAIVDLPEGEHQYKFYVDGQWTHDPAEPVVTNQLGTVNNIIQISPVPLRDRIIKRLMSPNRKRSLNLLLFYHLTCCRSSSTRTQGYLVTPLCSLNPTMSCSATCTLSPSRMV
ncbi:5'-AMP-activated protein kinase subunit beta-1a isoform X2 [Osmerus eperlanus]|uniref:5'-AMP-activated protein kinase subunit beta-1a isoform X2 n=1 Tax=Osmerus eperlanus TaxID=29151 RepID=UPI002E1551C8